MLQFAICWDASFLEALDQIIAEKFDFSTRFMTILCRECSKGSIKCHGKGTDAYDELPSSIGAAHCVALVC